MSFTGRWNLAEWAVKNEYIKRYGATWNAIMNNEEATISVYNYLRLIDSKMESKIKVKETNKPDWF